MSRGVFEPHASTTASYSSSSFSAETSTPTFTPHTNSTPSSRIRSTRRFTTLLSSFMLGMPYINSPPGFGARSNTVTEGPLPLSLSAAASPAGPEPTIATRLPLLISGTFAVIQPFLNPVSITASSLSCTVTLSPFIPQVQAASQRAGQTLPVNSGKLLVLSSLVRASCQSPLYIASFHSGIRLCRGHPLTIPPNTVPD